MADTAVETIGNGVINITYAGGGADWDSKTHFPGGLKVKAIKFFPSAANDVLKVRDGSASGSFIAIMKDALNAGSCDMSFGEGIWCCPYIVIGDQTFNTKTSIVIMIMIA